MKDEFSIADLDVAEEKVEQLTSRNEPKAPPPKKEEYITTTVSFTADVLDELKILAIRRRTNVRELLREAARDLLDKHSS